MLQSVRPNHELDIQGIDDDDEVDDSGMDGERISLEEEGEVVKKFKDPKLPTQEEVDKHYVMGHIPYRDWCPVCIKAQGREMGHMKDKEKERRLPEYSWDYCFPGNELGFKWSVLVGKERGNRSFMATTVPNKGGGSKFAVDKCLEFIEENGDRENNIIVKNDQEPSMQFVIKDLIEERKEGGTIIEESPVKSSGSNGVVEKNRPRY